MNHTYMKNNISKVRGSHNIAIGIEAGKSSTGTFNVTFGKPYYNPYREPIVNKLKELFEKL